MHRSLWIVGLLAGAVVAGFVAFAAFPQINEKLVEATCSMTAPDRGCRARMVALGHIWSGRDDLNRAAVWYRRGAETGDREAMFHLAWTHQQLGYAEPNRGQPGRLVSKFAPPQPVNAAPEPPPPNNMADAAKWYRQAADKGHAPSMNNLGQLYLFGLLGARDYQAAIGWHLSAARAGNPVAAINVALAYRIGQGVKADAAESLKWARFVPVSDSPDLDDMTLARTALYGSVMDAKALSLIRNAAAESKAVGFGFEPLKPAAGMPSFRSVKNDLSPAPREPTLKQLQR